MSEAERLFGQQHVRRYRETEGAVGHIWKRGSKTLLLTTSGRRTGKPTTTPLIYEQQGDKYVVVAPTGRQVEVLAISVVSARHRSRAGRTTTLIATHRTLWDQVGLLAQLHAAA